jgi:hypothetical protein
MGNSLELLSYLSLSHTHTLTHTHGQTQTQTQTGTAAAAAAAAATRRERDTHTQTHRGGERDQLLALVAFTPFPDIEDDVLTCNISPHTNLQKKKRHSATSPRGFKLPVYQAFSD